MTTVLEIVALVKADLEADSSNPHKARFSRDVLVLNELDRIKQKNGSDKEQYVSDVLATAKSFIKSNESALKELKEMRDRGASPSEVEEFFKKNPKVIDARGYLVLGLGLTSNSPDSEDAVFFKQFVESSLASELASDFSGEKSSTARLIANVSSSLIKPEATIETIHTELTNAVAAEIELISLELERIKKSKEASQNTNGSPDQTDSNQKSQDNKQVNNDQINSNNVKLVKSQFTLNSDGSVTEMNPTGRFAKHFGNRDIILEIWTNREKYSSDEILKTSNTNPLFIKEAVDVLEANHKGVQIGVRVQRPNGDINTIFIDGIVYQEPKKEVNAPVYQPAGMPPSLSNLLNRQDAQKELAPTKPAGVTYQNPLFDLLKK
jgi:hypothetical protein